MLPYDCTGVALRYGPVASVCGSGRGCRHQQEHLALAGTVLPHQNYLSGGRRRCCYLDRHLIYQSGISFISYQLTYFPILLDDLSQLTLFVHQVCLKDLER